MLMRRVALAITAAAPSVQMLDSALLRGFALAMPDAWRAVPTGKGVALVGGIDSYCCADWIVIGAPTTDPRGLPGARMELAELAGLLDRYGDDVGAMVAGPWLAVHRPTHCVIRPLNFVVPWYSTGCGDAAMSATDPALWGASLVTHSTAPFRPPWIADAAPGFCAQRLAAEVRSWIASCKYDVRHDEIWSPSLGRMADRSELVGVQVRSWIEHAQAFWLDANGRSRTLWVPALERVVRDQLSYALRGVA